MRLFVILIFIVAAPVISYAQQNLYWEEWNDHQIDSLQSAWKHTKNDTLRMAIARSLTMYYQERNRDSALYFGEYQLHLAQQLKQKIWEADASDQNGYVLAMMKNYPRSLQSFLYGINILEDVETENNIWRISIFSAEGNPRNARLTSLGYIHNDIGRLYEGIGNIPEALSNYFKALEIGSNINNLRLLSVVNMNLSVTYLFLNKPDSALILQDNALIYAKKANFHKYRGMTLSNIGLIYLVKGNTDSSRKYLQESLQTVRKQDNLLDFSLASIRMADLFNTMGKPDSGLLYANKGVETLLPINDPESMAYAYSTISTLYKSKNKMDSAFKYQGLAMKEKEKLNNLEKINQFQNIGFNEQRRLRKLEEEKIQTQNKTRIYSLLAALTVFLLIGILLYRNNRQKQKANKVLEKTLSNLKSTQVQLIQSEKMASLGELTAGIAHEIQNPLNFVNNFSEVNKELLVEMQEAMDKGDLAEARAIAGDVIDNQEKINHHGKRADSIVKGMLQHSRETTGQKEPTDLNKLVDEYLRLSYHGFRAKEKSFNATLKTAYDETIGKINIIPQDIGRVMLNLVNNAFYAVHAKALASADAVDEKKKSYQNDYDPIVSIITTKDHGNVLISVKDNGNGIPQKTIDKIFQPFFTTKPTGQGTGLGLSLSYDIMKAHGGEIKVKTMEGEGTEFIIQLPI